MICITGSESTAGRLRARLAAHREAELHEIRIDALKEPLTSLTHLDVPPARLLLTCRPVREGGHFADSEERRAQLLRTLLEERPGWLDIEDTTPPALRNSLIEHAQRVGTRVIVSHHDFTATKSHPVRDIASRLSARGADVIKIAVAVADAAQLDDLLNLSGHPPTPALLIGMGPAGLLSRALYPRFGSPWTYVAADATSITAPGQLTLPQVRAWRLPHEGTLPLYAILGGPQVFGSPGPRVYNQVFAQFDIDGLYLPVITASPRRALDLLIRLGLRGASVTMPLKREVASLVDTLEGDAQTLGIANTITIAPDGTRAASLTDGQGAVAALARHTELSGRDVVIVGTGSTALAIAYSTQRVGARVTILGRNPTAARSLGERLQVDWGELHHLPNTPFEVLINATPVGSDGSEHSVVNEAAVLREKVVLDVVLAPTTPLLRQCARVGGLGISGYSMWAEQGLRQLNRWTGMEITAETLEALI